MEGATERVRSIVSQRLGRFGTQPPKTFLANVSLLLFDYGGDGLTMEDFNVEKPKKIGENWERFTKAYMHMRHVLGEYVSGALGKAIDSLYVNLINIRVKYSRMRTSALMYLTQQLLGKLRILEPIEDRPAVEEAIDEALQLLDTSPLFQEALNIELMGGVDEGGYAGKKRGADTPTGSPLEPPKRPKAGSKPTRPPLQGPYPCYSWIKELPCCKGPTCGAPKRKGFHPTSLTPSIVELLRRPSEIGS